MATPCFCLFMLVKMLLQPSKSNNSDFPLNLLSIEHSFGYDSQRYYNLMVMPGPVLVYITGRFLHFYCVKTKCLNLHKSSNKEGIGQITSHPTLSHLAVGENGPNASVMIYDWPSMKLVMELKSDSSTGYSALKYNTDGSLLATVSRAPDHLLTLWKWQSNEILLQAKAHERDVYAVSFSNSNPAQLATCGVGHLKVWKMSKTFTGLKLEEELGRFGKTDTCDLVHILPLLDGSCATGSPWGNVIVWAEGSIRLEVVRNGRLPCHSAPITQLALINQSLLTAGMDGGVRIWNYENLESADPTEEDPYIETEPLFEMSIEQDDVSAQILSLVKANNDDNDPLWFAQDGRGGIWSVEITMTTSSRAPERVFSSHSGPVVAMQTSIQQPLLLTLASDNKLIVFNYETKTKEWSMEFNSPGTCLQWLPASVAPSGNLLLAGFADGVLRLLMINNGRVNIVQAYKPHCKTIIGVTVQHKMIITASKDATIFLFHCFLNENRLELIPLGYCTTISPASYITWHNNSSILVGCKCGQIMVFGIPNSINENGDKNTFLIDLQTEILDTRIIYQNILNNKNACAETVENNLINFLWTASDGNLWFSLENKLVEYSFNEKKAVKIIDNIIPSSTSICSYLHWKHGNSLLFGLSDGRLFAVKIGNDGSLTEDWWSCGVHDSLRGSVRSIATSWDETHLFSCADDSAIFSFEIESYPLAAIKPQLPQLSKYKLSADIEDPLALTLEEAKIKANMDQTDDLANKRKQTVLETLKQLKEEYKSIMNLNNELPEEVKFTREEIIIDERIVNDLNATFNEKKQLVFQKMGRDAERSEKLLEKLKTYFLDDIETMITRISAIKSNFFVETFRLSKLNEEFYTSLASIKEQTEIIQKQGSTESAPKAIEVVLETVVELPDAVESLVKQVSAIGDVAKNRKLTAVSRQHKARRAAVADRKAKWNQLMNRAPNPNITDPRDLRAIERAKLNMGDYKLKTSPDYRVSDGENVTTLSVNKTLLTVHQRIYTIKKEFNNKVLHLRTRKQDIIQKHEIYQQKLNNIANTIPQNLKLMPPELPIINQNLEFPENQFSKLEKNINNGKIEENSHEPNKNNIIDCKTEIGKFQLSTELETQSNIINEMNTDIENFDADVKKLMEGKIGVEVDVKFLDLFILKLNREILLLKFFENDENEKYNFAFNLLRKKQETQLKLNELSENINEKLKEIQELKDEIKKITISFMEIIAENKYYEFFKKTYKKKFKPPKIKIDDSDDSLSSDTDSESDMEEDKSIDSKEVMLAKLRESICPDDCDRELYEKTFEERSLRHSLELSLDEKQIEISNFLKVFDNLTKEIDKIDAQYDIAQKDLEHLQREKLKQLNEIDTVVVLKLSQFQNFKDEINFEDMNNSLVMDTNLLSNLYSRIADLNRDTNDEKERYEQNKQHLKRMGIDIRYMEELVLKLNKDIQETMLRKFGTKIDLDELEEAVVKRLVAEMNYIPFEMEKQLNYKLVDLQDAVKEKSEKYARYLVENTKRCNLLTLLKDEKHSLEDILVRQDSRKPVPEGNHEDVQKLREMVSKQIQQIQSLKQEIACYKMKSRPVSSKDTLLAGKMQIIMMNMPDGSQQPISASLRDQLLIIAADLQELFTEINSDHSSESELKRLKKLVEEFMDAIPEAALRIMWTKLSNGSDADLDAMLENRDILLKAAQMITIMVQPIVTSISNNTGE